MKKHRFENYDFTGVALRHLAAWQLRNQIRGAGWRGDFPHRLMLAAIYKYVIYYL